MMLLEIDDRSIRQPRRAELQAGFSRALRVAADRKPAEIEDTRTTPDPVPPERLQLARAGILHLSPIVGQLVELWCGPECDEYGRLRPTQHAFDTAVCLLVDAAIEGHFDNRKIPHGCVSTDSNGGVRIEWVRDGSTVHLIVPAAQRDAPFVYHELADAYATEDVTPERLSYWLRAIA
jgi:hypothetical protein